TGGILVWDGKQNTRGYSGNFITNFLQSQGHTAVYMKDFPTSLSGFDAVFLSFGVYADNLAGTEFSERMADSIVSFMERGGKVYIEGSDIFEYHVDNDRLNSLFGIDTTAEGTAQIVLDSLTGTRESICDELIFDQFMFRTAFSPDIYEVDDSGSPAFIQPGYGVVAVQNSGEYGQKSFLSVYPVSEIVDIDNPRCRYELVARILDFFGIEDTYSVAGFTTDVSTGHAPLTVEFEEASFKNIAVKTRYWDFNSDNITDSEKKYPSYTFPKPGTHNVNLKISHGAPETETNSNISVFNGESALEFDAGFTTSEVTNSDKLNMTGPITIEAWINPRGFGKNTYGRIVDKARFLFFMTSQNNIRCVVYTENNKSGDYRTEPNSISYNKWQHVAVTYDAVGELKIYINGEDQLLNDNSPATGKILDNSDNKLYIGNRADRNRTFDGRIDDLRIWNKVRSQEEIRDNLLHELKGSESGLVGYWKFDEGNGPSSDDSSPNDNQCSVYADWRQGRNESYIMTLPADIEACYGTNAEFAIETYEFSSLEFLWFKDDAELEDDEKYSGTTSGTLLISNADPSDEAEYKCRINVFGTKVYQTIDPVTLTVIPEINITLNSNDLIAIDEGGKLELAVEIDHSYPFDISWTKDGNIIDGANSEILIVNNLAASDSGDYVCTVTDKCDNPVQSKTVTVKILVESVAEEFIRSTEFKCSPSLIKDHARVSFNLRDPANIRLELADINGRKISDLAQFVGEAGLNSLSINSADYRLASGAYILILHIENQSQSIIINIIK
nr:hypothetical protein [Candidatus Kapabacteria bacterium]